MKINKYLRGKKTTHLHLQSTEEPSPGRCTPAGQCSGISAPWCRYQKVKNESTWIKNQVALAATRLAARLCTHWPKTSPHLNWTSVKASTLPQRESTLWLTPVRTWLRWQWAFISRLKTCPTLCCGESLEKTHTHTGRNKPRCCNSSWGSALCQHTGCMVKKKDLYARLNKLFVHHTTSPPKKEKDSPPSARWPSRLQPGHLTAYLLDTHLVLT